MSNDFNWQTDDKDGWDEPSVEVVAKPTTDFPGWFKRWGPWLGGGVILLVIVGFVIYSLLNRQVEQVEDTTTADILAAHSLVRQAALERDIDLLATMLSDRNRSWSELQLELLNTGLFLDRQQLNLRLIAETTLNQENDPIVTLSPDLQTAEVVETLPYEITSGERLSETVWLEQTYHYERQAESWFLTELPDDNTYWGNWSNTEYGEYFTLVYSEKDEAIADYLGLRFEELLDRICQDDAIECPSRFHVEFRLERRADSLKGLNENYFNISLIANQGVSHYSMPSPTLIGRPVDESDYNAIFQGYANWLGAVVAIRYSAERATVGAFSPRVFPVDETLATWGLAPPPRPVLAMPVPRQIPSPPIPFPEQDVLIACNNVSELTLLRYNPRANQWTNDLAGQEIDYLAKPLQQFSISLMTPFPDDSGILLSLNNFEPNVNNFKFVAWQAGQEQLWLELDASPRLIQAPFQQQFDPSGQNIIVFNFEPEETNPNDFKIVPQAINIESCQSGDCALQNYDGFPFWSPDLSWLLILDPDSQNELTLRNNETGETTYLGSGFSPNWLDENSFVFVRSDGDNASGPEPSLDVGILAATVDDVMKPTLLLDAADITEAIGGSNSTLPVIVQSVVAHPDNPDWLFIVASAHPDADPQNAYLLTFRRDTSETTMLIDITDHSLTSPLQFSSDGQKLSFSSFGTLPDSGIDSQMIRVIPLDPTEMTVGTSIETIILRSGFNYDWSQDGRWLLIPEQNALRFIALGRDYDQSVPYNIDFCYEAAWVNPISEQP